MVLASVFYALFIHSVQLNAFRHNCNFFYLIFYSITGNCYDPHDRDQLIKRSGTGMTDLMIGSGDVSCKDVPENMFLTL